MAEQTPYFALPLPAQANTLRADVERLRQAITAVDAALQALTSGKANATHGHAQDDIAGLATTIDGIVGTTNAALATKQSTLVSGSTIKTVAGQSLLGSGNVATGDVLYGTPDPDNAGGADGDVYLQTNGKFWKKSAGAWTYTGIQFAPYGATLPVQSISSNTNAVAGSAYLLTASLTLTLPAAPSVDQQVGVINASGTKTCTVARNGALLMGLAENLSVDTLNAGFTLVYTGASKGWWIR